MITQDRVTHVLSYDTETGIFQWRNPTIGHRKVGDVAGRKDKDGYIDIQVDGKRYKAHRLAWLYVHGSWPPDMIDHINRVPDDNRIANLRLATHQQNQGNKPPQKNNKSGYKGVRKGFYGGWTAQIVFGGKQRHLGSFSSAQEASIAYQTAARELFSEFARFEP